MFFRYLANRKRGRRITKQINLGRVQFINEVEDLRQEGFTEQQIADTLGITTGELRELRQVASSKYNP